MAFLMISKNYSNTLVVQLFVLLFLLHCLCITNTTCFIFKWRSVIIMSHICIINYVISFKVPKTSLGIRIIATVLNQIVHRHCNINKTCIINKSIVNFRSTVFKQCTIFKCCLCYCIKCYISSISSIIISCN